jgi:hypothetical protein
MLLPSLPSLLPLSLEGNRLKEPGRERGKGISCYSFLPEKQERKKSCFLGKETGLRRLVS